MCPADREAIEALHDRGVVVTIATGRMYSGTRYVARSIGIAGPVACIDGSNIVNVETDESLICHSIDGAVRARIGQLLTEMNAATVVFSTDTIYYDQQSHPYLPFLSVWSDRLEQVDGVLADPRWTDDAAATAAVAIASRQDITALQELIRREFVGKIQTITFSVQQDDVWGMVLRASGVSKGTALAWMAWHHGITIQETVAVGDWLNDIPMLVAAGRSFCMAHAPAEVAEAATERLSADGWHGGGIAEAARRCEML